MMKTVKVNNMPFSYKLSCFLSILLLLNLNNFCECTEQSAPRDLPASMKQAVFQDEFYGVNTSAGGHQPGLILINPNPNVVTTGNVQMVPNQVKEEGRTFGIIYDLVSTLVWSLFMLNGIILVIAVDYLVYITVAESWAKQNHRHRRNVEETTIDRIASKVISAIGKNFE